jgi:signal transduction histidine kinase
MNCFEGTLTDPVFAGVAGFVFLAAINLIWVLRTQKFNGVHFYALTFVGGMWALLTVGFEAASSSAVCKLQWATLAWFGYGLLSVAWTLFVMSFVGSKMMIDKLWPRVALVLVPLAAVVFVATNHLHHLVYSDVLPVTGTTDQNTYIHGPGFYLLLAVLYAFVACGLVCLVKAFLRAKRSAYPLLIMLTITTLMPVLANAAYVGLGFTVLGQDPTSFMFTLGIVAFSWLLATNKTIDMTSVGKSVLFDTMSEPIVLVDRRRQVVLTNTAARTRGLDKGQSATLNAFLQKLGRSEPCECGDYIKIGERDYEPRVQGITNPLCPDGDTLGWSVTFVDVTERIAMNESLQAALKKADDAMRTKDDFVSVVSHEMRTPLTSLKGALSLALSGHLGELDGRMHSVIDLAHRNGIRLSRLIDQILLAQKMDLDALKLEHVTVELGQLLEDSLVENRSFASEQSVTLVSTPTEPAYIEGDAFAIRQIIDNLVSNAIKFSGKDSVVEGKIEVWQGRVRLSIQDMGQGIPEGMEDKVFGRFEQIPNSGQHATQGSGLGMHISRNLARKMQGDIFYESQVGVGTTFYVEFPLSLQGEHRLAEAGERLASARG